MKNCRFFARIFMVAGTMVLCLWCFARLMRPSLPADIQRPTADEIRAAVEARDDSLPLDNPMRIWRDVDYSEGAHAAWWPKGEAPILAELVEEGKLPPVAERVGPEPCVMEGVDSIGKYGGTWLRLNGLQVGSRMTYCSLVRYSPQGFPIVAHLAKAWESSEDYRDWTFYLRRGVKWSDGHPFTAADIQYWWEQEVTCEEVSGSTIPNYLTVKGKRCRLITYPDDPYKVTFSFPAPKGNFLALMASVRGAQMTNSPAHYLRKYHPVAGDAELIEKAMAKATMASRRSLYGYIKAIDNPYHPRLWPWIIRCYKANPPDTAVRNPYYWVVDTEGNQLPYIDQILSEQVSQDMVPLRATAGGVSFQSRYIGFENYTYLMDQRKAGGYKVYHWYPGDRTRFGIQLNQNRRTDPAHPEWAKKKKLLRDKRFRQALSLAINRNAIIQAVHSGQTEPAQVAPGRESPFFHERALKAFTEHDPERARALLDDIGLTQYDSEGYRTHLDGSRMTFYFDYTRGLISSRPVQFVVDDWREVGVRVIQRERQRTLWEVERMGLQHDINVWIGNCEYYPIIEPRYFAPSALNCYFAQAYAKWFTKGGLYGDPDAEGPGAVPLPPDHPLRDALNAYLHACETADIDEQVERFRPALDIAAENVWSIGISTPPPTLVVVQDYMRNIPDTAIYTWEFQSPANAGIETFYMTESNSSAGTRAQIKHDIEQPTGRPGDLQTDSGDAQGLQARGGDSSSPHEDGSPGGSGASARISKVLIKVLIWAAVSLVIVLAVVRHPYIGRRLLIMAPTLAVISIIVFIVIQLPPGDYLTSRIMQLKESGDVVDMQQIREIKEQFYLDEPVASRYLRWMGVHWFFGFEDKDKGLLQGHLGRSMQSGKEVNEIIGDRLILTMLISLGTILFTWAVAVPTGIYSAVRQYSVGDYIFTFIGFIGMCVPSFLLALLLMYASYEWLGISITGLLSPEYAVQAEWDWPKIKDLLAHIWLPVVVLGMTGTAGMIRVMRANLLDELKKPYVVTARAKGVKPLKLLMKYPVRIALNPFISGIGGIFPQLVSGGAIVAVVLSLPTVGPLMLEALMTEDMYLAGSLLMVLSLLGVIGTLVSDLLLLVLDPRIRMEK